MFSVFLFAVFMPINNCCFIVGGGNTQNKTSVTCDFENTAICGYTQDKTDNFQWLRKTGGTSTGSTGPSSDHTTGTNSGTPVSPRTTYIKATVFLFFV